jgi:hypothetical protein
MSPEEMRRELLTSEMTGLPNRRAFDEAGASPATAMFDVDGLKALNEYAYEVGNAVLKAKANALRDTGLEAYYDNGDEFLCRGHDMEDLYSDSSRLTPKVKVFLDFIQTYLGTDLDPRLRRTKARDCFTDPN